VHHRLVELSQPGAGALQIAPGDDARLLQTVVTRLDHLSQIVAPLALEDLDVRRQRAAEIGANLVGARRGAAARILDQAELEESGVLDQPLDALRILDARQLNHDAVAAQTLAHDRGLGDAELVDAVANRLQSLVDRLFLDLAEIARRHIEQQALAVAPQFPARQVVGRRAAASSRSAPAPVSSKDESVGRLVAPLGPGLAELLAQPSRSLSVSDRIASDDDAAQVHAAPVEAVVEGSPCARPPEGGCATRQPTVMSRSAARATAGCGSSLLPLLDGLESGDRRQCEP
jgi:hypothetical protein